MFTCLWVWFKSLSILHITFPLNTYNKYDFLSIYLWKKFKLLSCKTENNSVIFTEIITFYLLYHILFNSFICIFLNLCLTTYNWNKSKCQQKTILFSQKHNFLQLHIYPKLYLMQQSDKYFKHLVIAVIVFSLYSVFNKTRCTIKISREYSLIHQY